MFQAILVLGTLLSADAQTRLVGDFAPLQVGNRWEYTGNQFSMTGMGQFDDSIARTVTVTGMSLDSGQTRYVLQVRDSLFHRIGSGSVTPTKKADTIISFSTEVREDDAGALEVLEAAGMIAEMFRGHTWPEGSVTGGSVNGQAVPVVRLEKSADGSGFQDAFRMEWGAGLGLISYTYRNVVWKTGRGINFRLTRFNGAQVVSLSRDGLPRTRVRGPALPPWGDFRRNLLGRAVPDP